MAMPAMAFVISTTTVQALFLRFEAAKVEKIFETCDLYNRLQKADFNEI